MAALPEGTDPRRADNTIELKLRERGAALQLARPVAAAREGPCP